MPNSRKLIRGMIPENRQEQESFRIDEMPVLEGDEPADVPEPVGNTPAGHSPAYTDPATVNEPTGEGEPADIPDPEGDDPPGHAPAYTDPATVVEQMDRTNGNGELRDALRRIKGMVDVGLVRDYLMFTARQRYGRTPDTRDKNRRRAAQALAVMNSRSADEAKALEAELEFEA